MPGPVLKEEFMPLVSRQYQDCMVIRGKAMAGLLPLSFRVKMFLSGDGDGKGDVQEVGCWGVVYCRAVWLAD